MPKGGKKHVRKTISSDVKLSDFANCSGAGKLRKPAANLFPKEVKSLLYEEVKKEDDKLWDEKDLEDFDFSEIPIKAKPKKKNHSRSRTTSDSKEKNHSRSRTTSDSFGVTYPMDIWFIIGEYIKPEGVKAFALICKDSHFVTTTYSFWIKMYRRHYKSDVHLPKRLQPDTIEGAFSLKVCVIRALYHMYPHFKRQLSPPNPSTEVYELPDLCCIDMWRKPQGGKWLFHFKFRTPIPNCDNSSCEVIIKRMWNNPDLEEKVQNNLVNVNPDAGCKILTVLCSNFVNVPRVIMGSRLLNASVNLARDRKHQKLQLTFSYSNYKTKTMSTKREVYGEYVTFDPAENITVLNWWHPQYPNCYKI